MRNIHIICVLGIFAVLFICIGHIYREAVQNKLKQELIHLPETSLDWWSVSHFLLFAIFGVIEPGHHSKFFMLGAAFEIIEDILSADETTQLMDCGDPAYKNDKFYGNIFCNGIQNDYWYGKWDDVFVNQLGYMLGSSISTSGYGLKFE